MAHTRRTTLLVASLLLAASPLSADVAEDIGLDALLERVGPDAMPTGAGVRLAQVEADESGNYAPDESDSQFDGKTIHYQSGATGASFHATNVCQWMCGSASTSKRRH